MAGMLPLAIRDELLLPPEEIRENSLVQEDIDHAWMALNLCVREKKSFYFRDGVDVFGMGKRKTAIVVVVGAQEDVCAGAHKLHEDVDFLAAAALLTHSQGSLKITGARKLTRHLPTRQDESATLFQYIQYVFTLNVSSRVKKK